MTPLYILLQKMCKQISDIFSIRGDCNRHSGCSVFRASAQGGDRYPKHGADQSDRVLPQNRRRPVGTGKASVRCPRSGSNPAHQIAELPHKSKAGAFGCGHRNSKETQPGTGVIILYPGCYFYVEEATAVKNRKVHLSAKIFPSYKCIYSLSPAPKVFLPAFPADNFSAALPSLQAANWNPHFPRKRFLS